MTILRLDSTESLNSRASEHLKAKPENMTNNKNMKRDASLTKMRKIDLDTALAPFSVDKDSFESNNSRMQPY